MSGPGSSRSDPEGRPRSSGSHSRLDRALIWGWAAVIAILLLLPGDSLPDPSLSGGLETAIELVAHFVMFLALAFLVARTYGGPDRSAGRRSRVFGAILAYCVLLEIIQIAVPGRGFEFVDIAAGWLGALLGFRRGR